MHETMELNERFSGRRWSLVLFIVNVVGAVTYVIAASPSWAVSQERGMVPITGEPFVWALMVFPFFTVFGLANFFWVAYICFKRRWRSGRFWLMAAAVWLIAVCVDFAHH